MACFGLKPLDLSPAGKESAAAGASTPSSSKALGSRWCLHSVSERERIAQEWYGVAARPDMAPPTIQIFGTKKCNETRKAERFFKERGVRVQSIDLAQKGMSEGELRSVANSVGGMTALIDAGGKRYLDRGLKYAAPTGPRLEALLLEDPLLLRTPIVRAGKQATVGFQPDTWKTWL
jgi:arsenate reductase